MNELAPPLPLYVLLADEAHALHTRQALAADTITHANGRMTGLDQAKRRLDDLNLVAAAPDLRRYILDASSFEDLYDAASVCEHISEQFLNVPGARSGCT